MPVTVTTTWTHLNQARPTIYTALKARLGREPSHAELCADVQRVLTEGMVERAEQGKLRHQRGR